MTPPERGNIVERGGQCSAHVEVMIGLTQVQGELGHVRTNFDQVTETCKALAEKIDALSEKIQAPEVTKTWIVAAFGICGTLISVTCGVLVAVITNADKLSKLIGWGG